LLRAHGVADRCRIEGGDAFVAVPPGADVYVVSRVLFNWSDDDATRLLQTVRRAMSPRARLYIIENVIGEEGLGRFAANNLHLFMFPTRTITPNDNCATSAKRPDCRSSSYTRRQAARCSR
jgi:hypothetical protein